MRRVAILISLLVAACSGSSDDPDARVMVDARPPGPCNDRSITVTPPAGMHVSVGTAITWPTNPPSGGPHYPVWARWGVTYDPALERGYWVHNTEHGGVVLLYSCPGGCAPVVEQLTALQSALPVDPACVAPIHARTLVTPDPLLPAGVQVAASAWGAYYTADCYDEPSLRAFVDAHYAHGPEDLCGDGSAP